MNVLSPAVPFARGFAGAKPEDAAMPLETEPEAEAAGAVPRSGGALRIAAIAATAGALAALAVVFAARALIPPPQAATIRLEQVAHAAADLTDTQAGFAQKLRTLETESVATAETVAAVEGKLAAQARESSAMQAALTKLAADGTGSAHNRLAVAALFGVAAVQLHDAVTAGRPFDWELVNLRGIVPDAPPLLAALARLAPLAAGGVPTEAQLAAGLRTLALLDSQRQSIVGSGLELVGRVLGPGVVPPGVNPTAALISRAAARLEAGDLAGTLAALRLIGGDTALLARPLLTAGEARVAALAAVQTLLEAAREGLRGQLRAAAGGTPVLR